MPKPWSEVAGSDDFKALPPDQQDGARRQYFDDVVAPRVPAEHRDLAWDQFSTDTGVGRRSLPDGVVPSSAGAGRGSGFKAAAPASARSPDPAPAAAYQDPSGAGDGASIMQVAAPTRESVLEGVQLEQPQFDAAEAERLSNRAYAETHPSPGDPRFAAPTMRASSPIEAETAATRRGQAMHDAPLPVRAVAKAVSGAAQGVGGTLRAVGDFTGIDALKAAGGSTAQGAEQFEKAMGSTPPIEGFGPKSPVPYLADMTEGAASSLAQSAAYASLFGARAVIPLMSVMTAGQEYDKARNAGLSPSQALAGALPKGAFEAIGEKYTGLDRVAGAMGTLLNKGASKEAKKGAAEILIKSGIKEIPGEVITYLGQTGVDLLPGIGLNPNLTMGQFVDGLRDTVVQAGIMGGTMGGSGAIVRADPRIKRLRDAGETGPADLLQAKLDQQNTAASVDGELGGIAPLAEVAQKPDFQTDYRQLRTDGVKPVEAAGRSAVASDFRAAAATVGLSDKAVTAALNAARKIPIDRLPAFLHRFTQSLAAKGVIQPAQGVDALSGTLEATRDHAMNAAMGAVFQPDPGAAVQAEPEAVQAVDNIDRILNPVPVSETGASVPQETAAVAPVTDSVSEAPQVVSREAARPSVEEAAHEAATSPLNDLPEPTPAQKEAGNYKVGRVNLHGLNISIENPKGSERSGTSPDGTAWSNTMAAHYGYIRGTEGNDGDHVDTFIGPNPESQKVFVVDQVNKDGSFDEHKVLLGADSIEQADALYHANYHAGWTGRGAITQMPMDQFKSWVKDGVKSEPLGDLSQSQHQAANEDREPVHFGRDNVPLAQGGKAFKTRMAADQARKLQPLMRVVRAPGGFALTEKTAAQIAAQEKAAARLRNPQTSPKGEPIPAHAMIAAAGGLSQSERADIGIGDNPQVGNRKLFAGEGRGLSIERATERLIEEGYLPEGASHDQARALIKRSLTTPQYTPEGTERQAAAELEARRSAAMEAQNEAVAEVEQLSDNQFNAIDDADIPWDAAVSNASTEEAMRALGFSEQEIQDAIAKGPGIEGADSAHRGGVDERATSQTEADLASREGAPGDDPRGRSPTRRQTAEIARPQQTPSAEGVSVSGFETTQRADGTLAVRGDEETIREALADIPAKSISSISGGVLVGKSQAGRALEALQTDAPDAVQDLPAEANELPSSDAVQATRSDARPEALIELRKRQSVLRSLLKCLGA